MVALNAMAFEYLGVFGSRSLMDRTGRLSTDSDNSITPGHAADTAILATLHSWPRSKKGALFAGKLFIGLTSLACLLLAGPKAALIALLAAVLFLAPAKRSVFFNIDVGTSVVAAALLSGWGY